MYGVIQILGEVEKCKTDGNCNELSVKLLIQNTDRSIAKSSLYFPCNLFVFSMSNKNIYNFREILRREGSCNMYVEESQSPNQTAQFSSESYDVAN